MERQLTKLFINYRRQKDAGSAVRAIYERLAAHYRDGIVFFDVAHLRAGKFGPQLVERIRQADVMLVLIGKEWMQPMPSRIQGVTRLQDRDDWVYQEIKTALDNDVSLIPVRLESAPMPDRRDLPPEIQALSDWQAFPVDDQNFDAHMKRLIEEIDTLVRKKGSKARSATVLTHSNRMAKALEAADARRARREAEAGNANLDGILGRAAPAQRGAAPARQPAAPPLAPSLSGARDRAGNVLSWSPISLLFGVSFRLQRSPDPRFSSGLEEEIYEGPLTLFVDRIPALPAVWLSPTRPAYQPSLYYRVKGIVAAPDGAVETGWSDTVKIP